MPLFTTKPTDQLFERFMKRQPNFKPTPQKLTASSPSWTQKKKGKDNSP